MNKQTWYVGDLAGERKEKKGETKKVTIREKVLEEAKKAVCQDRNNQYGEPEDNFAVIAEFWSEHLDRRNILKDYLEPWDVAILMAKLKEARILTAKGKPTFDSFVDYIGYIACAAECIFGNENKE